MDTSRRNFLKASTATGLLAMTYAPDTLGAVGAKALEGGDKTVYSFCEMCSSRCPIEAKVVDGKTVFIQGNGKVGGTATSVCARGGSGHSQLYDPQRLVKPLIRVGERGEKQMARSRLGRGTRSSR